MLRRRDPAGTLRRPHPWTQSVRGCSNAEHWSQAQKTTVSRRLWHTILLVTPQHKPEGTADEGYKKDADNPNNIHNG